MISAVGKISILAIGSEILDGRVLDTNSRFSAEVLAEHGVVLDQILNCDDDLEAIKSALSYLLNSVDVVVCSGGLGPTNDDLTREAISQFANKPLLANQELLKALQQRYIARARPFDPSNAKQALIPQGAEVLVNPIGTAPGFALETSGKLLIALPGVPQEYSKMFTLRCQDLILAKFPTLEKLNTHTFKTFGLPEASVGSRISACNLEHHVSVSYRAHFPEVEVKLKSRADIKSCIEQVRNALEAHNIFSEAANETYAQAVLAAAKRANLTIFLCDSVTNGVLSQLIAEADENGEIFKAALLLPNTQLPAPTQSLFDANCRITLSCHNLAESEYSIVIEHAERRLQQRFSARFDPGFLQRYLAFCALKELHNFILSH